MLDDHDTIDFLPAQSQPGRWHKPLSRANDGNDSDAMLRRILLVIAAAILATPAGAISRSGGAMIRNAAGLSVMLIAAPVPGVADAFRVYVRDGPCMGSLAGTGHDDVAAAVSALSGLARE